VSNFVKVDCAVESGSHIKIKPGFVSKGKICVIIADWEGNACVLLDKKGALKAAQALNKFAKECKS
jgi:hypothetical protein